MPPLPDINSQIMPCSGIPEEDRITAQQQMAHKIHRVSNSPLPLTVGGAEPIRNLVTTKLFDRCYTVRQQQEPLTPENSKPTRDDILNAETLADTLAEPPENTHPSTPRLLSYRKLDEQPKEDDEVFFDALESPESDDNESDIFEDARDDIGIETPKKVTNNRPDQAKPALAPEPEVTVAKIMNNATLFVANELDKELSKPENSLAEKAFYQQQDSVYPAKIWQPCMKKIVDNIYSIYAYREKPDNNWYSREFTDDEIKQSLRAAAIRCFIDPDGSSEKKPEDLNLKKLLNVPENKHHGVVLINSLLNLMSSSGLISNNILQTQIDSRRNKVWQQQVIDRASEESCKRTIQLTRELHREESDPQVKEALEKLTYTLEKGFPYMQKTGELRSLYGLIKMGNSKSAAQQVEIKETERQKNNNSWSHRIMQYFRPAHNPKTVSARPEIVIDRNNVSKDVFTLTRNELLAAKRDALQLLSVRKELLASDKVTDDIKSFIKEEDSCKKGSIFLQRFIDQLNTELYEKPDVLTTHL